MLSNIIALIHYISFKLYLLGLITTAIWFKFFFENLLACFIILVRNKVI